MARNILATFRSLNLVHAQFIKRQWIHTSVQLHLPKEKSVRKMENELKAMQEQLFNEVARENKARDKKTFQAAIRIYEQKEKVYKRGHVEFIYAALDKMKEFGVQRDINVYRQLIDLFPKGKMVVQSAWQAEFMHYPKQQDCCIELLDKMEHNGVIPDTQIGHQLLDIFGRKSHVYRKYQRIMYWLPKFKYANPYYVPYELPDDRIEVAKLALKRMNKDLQNKLQVFHAHELENSIDDTFIVSSQSPGQCSLLSALPPDKPVYVVGGFNVWLRHLCLKYFILRCEVTSKYMQYKQEQDKKQPGQEEDFKLKWDFLMEERPSYSLSIPPTVHEQSDGTILATCITGTSSKDSLASWIKFLERTNVTLGQRPVVFLLQTPESGLQVIDGDKPLQEVDILDKKSS